MDSINTTLWKATSRKFMPTKTPPTGSRKIVISKDGPYIVSAGIPLTIEIIEPNAEGLSWNWKTAKSFKTSGEYKLCRCGQSKNKPFCDGSHTDVSFDGREAATRQPYARQADVFDGPTMTLSDAEDLCAFARFLRSRRQDLGIDGAVRRS